MNAQKETNDMATAATVFSRELEFPMREELDICDITGELAKVVKESGLKDGIVTAFVPGATGALTCLEYEPGVIADFRAAIERLFPRDIAYSHADGNGHAHVRAGLLGPSLAVPFSGGKLTLGVWQQVVLVNCDNRRRTRRVVIQVVGV
jgi:secondary thiamine-phosphate synthase enzyme